MDPRQAIDALYRAESRRVFGTTERPATVGAHRSAADQDPEKGDVMLQDFPLYSYIPAKDVSRARQFQAFWQVDDIEREVAELEARGVAFEHYDMPGLKREGRIYAGGGAKAAWFKDSEGNVMAIIQNDAV